MDTICRYTERAPTRDAVESVYKVKALSAIRCRRYRRHKKRRKALDPSFGKTQKIEIDNSKIIELAKIAQEKNEQTLLSNMYPDFGLDICAAIGETPFNLSIFADTYSVGLNKKGLCSISVTLKQYSLAGIEENKCPQVRARISMMTLEIYNSDENKVQEIINAFSSGIDVKANWGKKYFNKSHTELIVPINLLSYEEDRLKLKQIADLRF